MGRGSFVGFPWSEIHFEKPAKGRLRVMQTLWRSETGAGICPARPAAKGGTRPQDERPWPEYLRQFPLPTSFQERRKCGFDPHGAQTLETSNSRSMGTIPGHNL